MFLRNKKSYFFIPLLIFLPFILYVHLKYLHLFAGSVLCVGSEWHRYPSSFFVPTYIGEVRWIDDGFRGLLPFPFNSTLGTAAAPPYFNNQNKASDEQYVLTTASLYIRSAKYNYNWLQIFYFTQTDLPIVSAPRS